MSENQPASTEHSPDAARTLIVERDRLRGWLDQLDTHGAEVPGHVMARVRGDYQERLRRVTEQLGDHLGALRQSLAELRELAAAAEAQHVEARDELAEARLRHLIGELDTAAWDERRPALEAAVLDAERECTDVTDEVTRLAELVVEIEGAAEPAASTPAEPDLEAGAEAPEPQTEALEAEKPESEAMEVEALGMEALAEALAAPGGEEADEERVVDELFAAWGAEAVGDDAEKVQLPWLVGESAGAEAGGFDDLEFLREVSTPAEAAEGSGEEAAAEVSADLAFLEELDRVIASTAPGAEEPAQKVGGLTCKECGAANDARSWYCEICGMELT